MKKIVATWFWKGGRLESSMKTISQRKVKASAGTLVKESDIGCILVLAAMLEEMLDGYHRQYIARSVGANETSMDFFEKLFSESRPLSSFNGKIILAYAYGMIDKKQYSALNTVRRIRNEAAHCNFEFNLEDDEIKSLLNDPSLMFYSEIASNFITQEWHPQLLQGKRKLILSGIGLLIDPPKAKLINR